MNWTLRRAKVKREARELLAGNWFKGAALVFAAMLLQMFCANFIPLYVPEKMPQMQELANMSTKALLKLMVDTVIPQRITWNYVGLILICILLFLFLMIPLSLGLKQFFQQVARAQKPKMRVAFSWYLSIGKVFGGIGLYLWLAVLYVLWGVLIFAIPAAVMYAADYYMLPVLGTFASGLYAAGLFLFTLKVMAYVPAGFLYAAKPEAGVFATVRESVRITRGRLLECFVFRLSFLLWNILVLFTGNVGKIFF